MIEEGAPAPDFTLGSDSGEQVSLADLRGRPVVLYFYGATLGMGVATPGPSDRSGSL